MSAEDNGNKLVLSACHRFCIFSRDACAMLYTAVVAKTELTMKNTTVAAIRGVHGFIAWATCHLVYRPRGNKAVRVWNFRFPFDEDWLSGADVEVRAIHFEKHENASRFWLEWIMSSCCGFSVFHLYLFNFNFIFLVNRGTRLRFILHRVHSNCVHKSASGTISVQEDKQEAYIIETPSSDEDGGGFEFP